MTKKLKKKSTSGQASDKLQQRIQTGIAQGTILVEEGVLLISSGGPIYHQIYREASRRDQTVDEWLANHGWQRQRKKSEEKTRKEIAVLAGKTGILSFLSNNALYQQAQHYARQQDITLDRWLEKQGVKRERRRPISCHNEAELLAELQRQMDDKGGVPYRENNAVWRMVRVYAKKENVTMDQWLQKQGLHRKKAIERRCKNENRT